MTGREKRAHRQRGTPVDVGGVSLAGPRGRRAKLRAARETVVHDCTLMPIERANCEARGVNPDDYIAVPVEIVVDESRPGGIARQTGADGSAVDLALVPMMLAIPVAHLRMTRILGRLVVPRIRLQDHVIVDLERRALELHLTEELEDVDEDEDEKASES